MVRKLKPHEQKLLKKTNFLSWAADGFGKDVKIVKKFYIKKREHYALYTRLSAEVSRNDSLSCFLFRRVS